MKLFGTRKGLVAARQSLLFSEAALRASGEHVVQAEALAAVLTTWGAVWQARQDADDALARANARVAWCSYSLDRVIKRLANELLRDTGGKSEHPVFRAFFPEAPSTVVKLALEAKLERCADFAVVASRRVPGEGALAALKAIEAAMREGQAALKQRRDAEQARTSAGLDAASWRNAADATRQSVALQLQAWALANDEARSYAARFFPSEVSRQGAEGEASQEADEG
ncbi:MAG: hypothetical protein JNK72_09120 [Myxococcales bacterium]|nr:hypothetical protein [Myxococcales bacterium]